MSDVTKTIERVRGYGLELSVHRYRPAERRHELPALLLHGFLDEAGSFDDVAAELVAAGYEVIAPDLRGFGDSDHVGAGGYYHFPDYIADVRGLCDELGLARVLLVGHSMGGTVSLLFAAACPERVERLVVAEGLGAIGNDPAIAVDRVRAWLRDLKRVERARRPLASLEEAASRLATQHAKVDPEILRRRAETLTRRIARSEGAGSEGADGALAWSFDPLHRTTSPMPFIPAVFQVFLAEIACPVLFVSGGPDGYHPHDEEDRLAAIRHLSRAEIPDGGHMMHWTRPRELARILLDFWARSPPGVAPLGSRSA